MQGEQTKSNQSYQHNLKLSEELLSWYFDNTKDTLIFIWDEQDIIRFISEQVEDHFDINSEMIKGSKWTSYIEEQFVLYIRNHFLMSEKKCCVEDVTFKMSHYPYIYNGTIDQVMIEGKYYYICQLKNMKPINELKNFLVDTDKLITSSRLTAGLVHEIRNPLTSLKGFLQLVHSGIEQKEEFYQVMIKEVEKLEMFTNELLEMAKPTRPARQSEELHNMIDESVYIMRSQMDMRNVNIEVYMKDTFTVVCNATEIKQVLLNLIKNAAEAMEHKGTITIDVSRSDKYVHVGIIDEGIGITNEQIKELQTPFYSTKSSGTGLGLSISEYIIANHNGELLIESNENKGCTFTICLPLE